MKLNQVKVKAFDAADAATLEAALAAFLAGGKERTFVDLRYAVTGDGTVRSALVLFTE